MATKITITYNEVDYVLEYSRDSVRQMEQQGFVLDQISDKPMTMIPLLVQGAFIKNHSMVRPALRNEIYDNLVNKTGNDSENGFIQALLEMYAETVNVLTDNKPADEGNVATWKVNKG